MSDVPGPAPRVVEIQAGAFATVRIRADEGSSFFIRLDVLGLLAPDAEPPRLGEDLDEERFELLRRADEASRAAYKGLELLARAEHTRFLLSRKLLARDFSETAIRLALDALEAEGALHEERYAEAWLRSRLARAPRGPLELVAGLIARGLDGAVAREAVARLFGSAQRRDAIRALAGGKFQRLEPGVAHGRLRALGFGRSEILSALAGSEDGTESEPG